MKKIQNYLNSSYPVLYQRWKTSLVSCIIVFLILVLFQPFGISSIEHHKYAILLGYMVVTGMFLCIPVYLLPLLFPRFYDDKRWTVGRQIINQFLGDKGSLALNLDYQNLTLYNKVYPGRVHFKDPYRMFSGATQFRYTPSEHTVFKIYAGYDRTNYSFAATTLAMPSHLWRPMRICLRLLKPVSVVLPRSSVSAITPKVSWALPPIKSACLNSSRMPKWSSQSP